MELFLLSIVGLLTTSLAAPAPTPAIEVQLDILVAVDSLVVSHTSHHDSERVNNAAAKELAKVMAEAYKCNEYCYKPDQPCDAPNGCCPGLTCNNNNKCVPGSGAHLQVKVKLDDDWCHCPGEACGRKEGQCCPGYVCDLKTYECTPPDDDEL